MNKNLRPLIVSVVTIVAILLAATRADAAGPVSKLYLTAGDQQMIWVVQGTSVVNSWTEHFQHEYTLAGAFTGNTYPYPLGPGTNLYDGTTDTTSNYGVDYNTGNVYSFSSSWTNSTYLFSTVAGSLGITYDATDNTLWLANFNGNTVEHRSLFGTLISSFIVPFTAISCLALDPADNTLWMGS